ncbi:MAG: ATP-binding protein, partial [Lachnospiraceae bacterium]|nr:ATP-binding protein [Lachnospiraceae bacterium]
MFVGRKHELSVLNSAYEGTKPPFVILYGRNGIGKTTLLKEFSKDKSHIYYLGREYAKDEQQRHFIPAAEEVLSLVKTMPEQASGRICFLIDEFDQIYKGYKDFFADLAVLLTEEVWRERVMFVLCSSSIQWIENEMVKAMGSLAMRITNFIKVKEFSFLEMVSRFP